MHFIRLVVNGMSLLQHNFPFMYLCPLPDDGRMERPKRRRKITVNEFVILNNSCPCTDDKL